MDFSRNAAVYDRRHGAFLPADLAARLLAAARLPEDARILDLGAGTGRVAIPLAAEGRYVAALDLSCAMLAAMRQKAGELRVPAVAGEGTRLPFAAASFDAVVIARLVYLVPDWRGLLDEALRVLRPAGALLHEWGNGSDADDWVRVREQARALFAAAGVEDPFHPGARSEEDVDAFLELQGMRPATSIDCGGAAVSMRQFLARIANGECSYTWKLSPELQAACVPALLAWAEERFDLDQPIASGTMWKVFERQRGG